MIDRPAIEERRAALEVQRAALEGQINAVLGAIQDCDYWLAKLDEPPAEPRVKANELPSFGQEIAARGPV